MAALRAAMPSGSSVGVHYSVDIKRGDGGFAGGGERRQSSTKKNNFAAEVEF